MSRCAGTSRTGRCSYPAHYRRPGFKGTVITLEIEAKEPLPRWTGFGFGGPYPDLAAAGTPVLLDAPHAHRCADRRGRCAPSRVRR